MMRRLWERIKFWYYKYWVMRGSPIQPWLVFELDEQTRKEILVNGWRDEPITREDFPT